MNRSMDKFRIPQGIFLLSNVLLIFLPVVTIWQENYPEQVYSQLSFVQGYLISRTGVGASPASGFAPFMTVLLVVLPLVLAIFAGVCTLVEQFYGKYVRVAGVVSLCLYLCQFFVGTIFLWPKRLNTAQQYHRGIGMWLLLLVVLVSLAMYVIPMVSFSRRAKNGKHTAMAAPYSSLQSGKTVAGEALGMPSVPRKPASPFSDEDGISYTQTDPMRQIPHIESHTMSQTQTEINLPLESVAVAVEAKRKEAEVAAASPRGVMVGIAGVFAGKEIAFGDGETLRLGRDLANDLVFTNASHISRNHCLITWYAQKRKYYVEDRSSNGCFINGAPTRLPKNVEIALEPGTLIDIGDRTNRFRLE